MSKDYYKILGVEKNASQDDIKKAFRKKAHEYHPDKGTGNEAKFKEVNEAYQTLKDEKKRKQYDQFGSDFANGFGGAGGGGGFNWQDFARAQGQGGFNGAGMNFEGFDLGDIFGEFFGGARSGSGRARSRRGSDLEYKMQISLEESAFGGKRTIEVTKMDMCSSCSGKGYDKNSKMETCSTCKGQGKVIENQRTIFGAFQSERVCPNCDGQGKKPDKSCQACSGEGRVRNSKRLEVAIPAGINNGESIKITGEGEAGAKGSPSGDLYVTFVVEAKPGYRRDGYDIYYRREINIAEATLGAKVDIKTLDGEVNLKIPAGTESGKLLKISGRGAEKLHGRGRGDFIVEVVVVVPKKLSSKAKKAMEVLRDELR